MKKTTMTRPAVFAAAAISMMVAGAAVAAPPPAGKPGPAPAGAVPAPKILVIDRNAILRASKVGQDIVRQVNGYTQSAESEFKSQGQALQSEGRSLQQQVAILAPD